MSLKLRCKCKHKNYCKMRSFCFELLRGASRKKCYFWKIISKINVVTWTTLMLKCPRSANIPSVPVTYDNQSVNSDYSSTGYSLQRNRLPFQNFQLQIRLPVTHKIISPSDTHPFFPFLMKYCTIYIGLKARRTPMSWTTRLYISMPAIRRNHTEMTSTKVYPTLSAPKCWTEKSMNKIAIEMRTTCAAQRTK